MEFDECADNAGKTNFECAMRKYAEKGYTLPEIVFWNVESRKAQQPVTMNENGVALVSGWQAVSLTLTKLCSIRLCLSVTLR